MITKNRHARAFTIVPLALVLWIGLLILGVLLYLKAPPAGYVPAKGVGPGQIGSIILAVLYGGFWFFVIGRLAEKKGQVAANLTAVIVLGLAGVMLTLSYFGLTKDQRGLAKSPAATAPAGAPAAASAPTGPDKMVQSMRDTLDREQQTMQAARERDAQRAQRQQDMMDQMRKATPPVPGAAPATTPRDPSPTTIAPGTPTTPLPRAAEPAPDPDQGTIDRVAGEFASALEKERTDVLTALKPVLDTLTKQPKQDIRDLKARVAAIDEVRTKAADFSKRLRASSDDLEAALKAAGVSDIKAAVESGSRSSKSGWVSQSFAATRVLDLLDKGKEEAELLRDNIGKWKYDKDGKVSTKDFQLQSKINAARFFLDADLKRREQILDEMKGR